VPTGVVLDASVVISAVSPLEPRHSEALQFLRFIHGSRLSVHAPAHFLLEIYAVLSRSPREVRALGFLTEENPIAVKLKTIGEAEVEAAITWVASQLPGRSPTRGADLAYAWVARASGLPLVTLDSGLHEFTGHDVRVYYPGDLLVKWSAEC
jgi:predicted nucleic acid-binding protein